MAEKNNLEAKVSFGFVLRHPSWQLDDGPVWPTKFAIVKEVNRVQALKMMDSAEVYLEKDGSFYPVTQETVSAQVDKVIAGEVPDGEASTDVVRSLASYISAADAEDDCYGILAGKICKVDFADKVLGDLYYVTGYTGFNSMVTSEQEGYYLVFKYDAGDGFYSDVKMSVFGGTGKEVSVDDGINVVRLGSSKEEVAAKSLVISGKYTVDDEEFETKVVFPAKYLKLVEASIAEPETKPGDPVVPAAPAKKIFEIKETKGLNCIFLCGVPAVIKEKDGVTVLTAEGYEDFALSGILNIFGGGNGESHYATSKIVMESGNIPSVDIYGGGYGEPNNGNGLASVDKATIRIYGGTIHNVIGGGALKSKVGVVDIYMKNATAEFVQGGGQAYISNQYQVEAASAKNPELSSCIVDKTYVVIDQDATIKQVVYGGGQGYSCTNESHVTINNMLKAENWTVGAGSNGYTGSSELIINGGELHICHSLNRGWGKTATIEINGGTIDQLFPVSEEADVKTPNMLTHGLTEHVNVIINGGTVKELLPGFNHSNAVVAGDPKISVVVGSGATVENIDDAKTALGSSISVA